MGEKINGEWKSSGTSTRILWAAAIMSIVLTVATWICAVPLDMKGVRDSLLAVVTLIMAPSGFAITQYQVSKHLNQRHARYLENGNGGPEPPEPPEPPEAPRAPGENGEED